MQNDYFSIPKDFYIGLLNKPERYFDYYDYDGRHCAKHLTRYSQPVDKKIYEDIKREFFSKNDRKNVQGNFNGYKQSDFIEPHIKSKYLLKLDIAKCFNSITFEMFEDSVRGRLQNMDLVKSMYFKPNLVVGLSASPTISEVVLLRVVDSFINKLLNSKYKRDSIKYTRFYDDIFISGDSLEALKDIKQTLIKELAKNGLNINLKKTSLSKTDNSSILQAKINNKEINAGKKIKNNLRLQIYRYEVYEIDYEDLLDVTSVIGIVHGILGKLTHIIQIESSPSDKWYKYRLNYIDELDRLKERQQTLRDEYFRDA